jgi:RNA polymerase sigma factor for flagellar operon FliA
MHPYATAGNTATNRDSLVLEHMWLVHTIASRIHERLPGNVLLEDLVSSGVVGLISAIDNFDPSRNVALKTYAEYKIRGAILDGLRELDWAPRTSRQKAKSIQAAIEAARRKLGREPGDEDVAKEMKLSLQQYYQALLEVQGIDLRALEHVTTGQDGTELIRLVPDSEEKLPSRVFERVELERKLAEGIERMPKLERTLLRLYYQDELGLREIAQVLGCHVSRVSQLRTQAVLRLRAHLERVLSPPSPSRRGWGERANRIHAPQEVSHAR